MPIFGVPMLQNAHFFFSNCKMPKTPYIFFIWLFWVCFRYCKMPIFAQNGHFAISVSVNIKLQNALFLNVWGLWPQTDSLCNLMARRGSVRPSIVTRSRGSHPTFAMCEVCDQSTDVFYKKPHTQRLLTPHFTLIR